MELRFDTMLCSDLGDGKSDAGHIKCPRGPQFLQPWSSDCQYTFLNSQMLYIKVLIKLNGLCYWQTH